MKKLLVVMNPFAGTRQANRYLAGIIDIFCKGGYEVGVAMTQKAGDGIALAEEHARDNDIIVAIGGDGTFNEVVAGVLDSGTDIPIGYIPGGTTNDFASSVGLNTSTLDAAKSIISGRKQRFDVGKFNGRYFSYVASFGAFTSTAYNVPQDLKNAIGHAAYVLSGITDAVNIKPFHLKVYDKGEAGTGAGAAGDHDAAESTAAGAASLVNGVPDNVIYEDDYIFGAICNSTSMGGIINLKSSDVDMNDGLFEVMLIKAPKDIIDLQAIIFALSTQSYSECEQISFFSSSSMEIEAPEDMPWTLDGEYQEPCTSISISNVYNAIQLMLPA